MSKTLIKYNLKQADQKLNPPIPKTDKVKTRIKQDTTYTENPQKQVRHWPA